MSDINEFRDFVMKEYNIINPILTFDGDYILGSWNLKEYKYDENKDLFIINSKVDKNGNNMYKSYVERKLLYNFQDYRYKDIAAKYFRPILLNRMDEDGKGRHLEYSLTFTLYNMMEDKERLSNVDLESYEAVEVCINYYKEVRKDLKNILKDDNYIPTTNIEEAIALHIDNFIKNTRIQGDVNQYMDRIRKGVIEYLLDFYSSVIYIYRCIGDMVKHPVRVSEEDLLKCFDIDEFILLYCKSILDDERFIVKRENRLSSSFVIVTQIINTLRDMGIKNYNPSIMIYDNQTRKHIKYNFNDLIKDHKKLYDRFQEQFRPTQVSFDQVKRMGITHDNEAFEKFIDVISNEDQKIIKTEFDILAKGEGGSTVKGLSSYKGGNSNPKKAIDDEEILYRRYIFQNTNYVCQIVGKDKFNGYIGYIYENGLVVFERFYEDDGSPAKSNATYIMNKDNFVEFIQLTKPEILEYIRYTDNPEIKRLYHSKNWANNLEVFIKSIDKNMDTIMFANSISNEQGISRVLSDK